MGSRRDNRGAVLGPHRPPAHAKMDHERRNHELLKRLASDTSTAKTAKSVLGVSPMSKSLTEALEGAPPPGQDPKGKSRGRKKSELDKALRSFQRQTSSSMLKMSNAAEASPGKQVNPGNKNDRRGNQLENARRSDVFERLSKGDSNKSVGRTEHFAGKAHERSPLKSGRRSPQEKTVGDEKHQSGRKTGVGDATGKPSHQRRRDVGEVLRREAAARGSLTSGAGVREEEEDDGDVTTEKQEQEKVPETVDKDRDDPPVRRDTSSASHSPSSASPPRPSVPPSTPQERQRQAGPAPQDLPPPRSKVDGQGTGRTSSCASARRAAQHASTNGRTSDSKVSDTSSSSNRRKLDRKAEPKTTTIVEPRRKPGRGEDSSPGKAGNPQGSPRAAEGRRRSSKVTNEAEVVTLSSACDVLQKVRERVNDGHVHDRAKSANGVGPEVIDDDKDVCEADKAEDDCEFYKISVQTRLVTYNNSTLVIKNTSKSEGAGDGGGASDVEAEATDHTSSSSSSTLQTSSVGAAAATSADVEGEAAAHAPPCPTEAQQEEGEEGGAGDLTRTRSVRRKLAQFVSKGRSFLSDVYSATQTKLEQYTRTESPSSTASWDAAGDTRPESPCSIGSWDAARDCQGEDTDSGYYTIPPPLVETNPLWVEDHDRPASWPQEGDAGPVPTVGSPESLVSSDSQDRICMAEPGMEEKDGVDIIRDEEDSKDVRRLSSKVDEEWIKKNILCTCECNDRTAKGVGQVCETGGPEATQEEDPAAPGSSSVESHSDALTHTREASPVEVSSREGGAGEGEGEMCYCSCHDSGHDPLPQEVQELLDADHARMWWTITGNFGNILPIDWSKTYTRQQYLPVLNLNEIKDVTSGTTEETDGGTEENAEEEEEEEVAQDLDLHHLILNGLTEEPVKTAEEVIQEIDDIMQEGSSSEDECVDSSSSGENTQEPTSRPFPPPLYAEKLKNMSVAELNESLMELELVIRQYSETLINQLALRDELEYEKELKNSFISLLLQVQNKRRNFNVEKKKQKKVGPNGTDPKYLTTVIPYDVGHGPPHNPTLQILIKILMAINEDSPTVPTLLTDYILKVLCPS